MGKTHGIIGLHYLNKDESAEVLQIGVVCTGQNVANVRQATGTLYTILKIRLTFNPSEFSGYCTTTLDIKNSAFYPQGVFTYFSCLHNKYQL